MTAGQKLAAIASLLAVVGAAPIATAFEFAGFRSGMTRDEVRSAADAAGRYLLPLKGELEGYSFGQGKDFTGVVQLCDGVVFFVSSNLDGEVDAFALTARQMMQRYGQPVVDAQHNYGSDGLISWVELRWSIQDGDEARLSITRFQNQSGTSLSYTARDRLC